MKWPKIGPTGTFPHGKLNEQDSGALNIGVAVDDVGNVHVNFGTRISWFAMPPEQAINLAKLILTKAGAKKIEITL